MSLVAGLIWLVLKSGCELVTANTTIDEAKATFAPAIKFFEDLLAKYSAINDKKLKKSDTQFFMT